ncbi:MAG TPA: hypothetical protein VH352_05455 [Pseudonocardiaceae bacterium]|nr:hypothetical protein [Pseudonocardiaceae bacterium]
MAKNPAVESQGDDHPIVILRQIEQTFDTGDMTQHSTTGELARPGDVTAIVTTVVESRDDLKWLKRAVQALLTHRGLAVEPAKTDEWQPADPAGMTITRS